MSIKLDKVGYHIKIIEVEWDFSRGDGVLQEETVCKIPLLKTEGETLSQGEKSELPSDTKVKADISGEGSVEIEDINLFF